MNKRGQLKVNEFLQVEGYNDIFAIGDCNNFDVSKFFLVVLCYPKSFQKKFQSKNSLLQLNFGYIRPVIFNCIKYK